MIESQLLHGDQMVMEIGVWEVLARPDRYEYINRKDGLGLTITFRVLLQGPNLVVVTASPHHPDKCCSGDNAQVNSAYQEGTTAYMIGRMLGEYQLSEADRVQIFDEVQSFLGEHMPPSDPPFLA